MSQYFSTSKIEVPRPMVYRGIRFTARHWLLRDIELSSNGIENVPSEGGVSIEANHRNDDYDVLAAGLELSKRRAPYYPAKKELDEGIKGWILEGCGALFFVRGDGEEARRIRALTLAHIKAGHAVLNFIEGTSKNEGRLMGKTFNSATSNAIDAGLTKDGLEEIVLVGIGGTDTAFRQDAAGLAKQKREKPEKIHVEIGKVNIADVIREYKQAEKAVPRWTQKAIHKEVVVPALQQVVDIAYEQAAA